MFFDPETTEIVENTFEPLPKGNYRVLVESCDYGKTKKGDGQRVALTFQVIDGPYQGRKLFCNFNIHNPVEMAQRIGRSDFKKFLMAIGITRKLESEYDFKNAAMNKTLYVGVTVGKDHKGDPNNDVKEFSAFVKGSGPIASSKDGEAPF